MLNGGATGSMTTKLLLQSGFPVRVIVRCDDGIKRTCLAFRKT